MTSLADSYSPEASRASKLGCCFPRVTLIGLLVRIASPLFATTLPQSYDSVIHCFLKGPLTLVRGSFAPARKRPAEVSGPRLDPARPLQHGPPASQRRRLGLNYDLLLPLAALPFPKIDPVLVQIGPLAIHWYGLAYIVGILFAWWYAKRLAANAASVARRAEPAEAGRPRRFPGLGGDRRRRRRPHRLRPVLRSPALHRQSAGHLRGLAGRHVVPWRLPRNDARHDPVRPAAQHPGMDAFRCHRRRRAGRARSGARCQFRQFRAVGQLTSVPWAFDSPMAARFRATRRSSTKPAWKDLSCSSCCAF